MYCSANSARPSIGSLSAPPPYRLATCARLIGFVNRVLGLLQVYRRNIENIRSV